MSDKVPKMPSMKHLPWSQENARKQKWLGREQTREMFEGERVVITEKADGANACLTSDKVYARSHSAEPHREEWDYLKKKHREELMHKISDQFAVFGEYLYARHSIKYEELPAYFLVFGVYYKKTGEWLSWNDTVAVAEEIGLPTVPVIANLRIQEERNELVENFDEFVMYEDALEDRMPEGESEYGDTREGYIVRNYDGFKLEDLTENMAKCVREDHVQTEELHWRKGGETETNELGEEK
jgi:hypothetical protein